MNIERWQELLVGLRVAPESDTFSRLQSAYAQKHRAYHTSRHIDECLSLFDGLKDLAEYPGEVECALWFHDAIYEPMSKLNEERSANWVTEFGAGVGLESDTVARIRAHIMATRHVALPAYNDSRLVVDIDLAILGAVPSRCEEFERDVRREYRWVPGLVYRPKRAAILQSFLDRPRIYHWELAYARFERQARVNVSGAIRTLVGESRGRDARPSVAITLHAAMHEDKIDNYSKHDVNVIYCDHGRSDVFRLSRFVAARGFRAHV